MGSGNFFLNNFKKSLTATSAQTSVDFINKCVRKMEKHYHLCLTKEDQNLNYIHISFLLNSLDVMTQFSNQKTVLNE